MGLVRVVNRSRFVLATCLLLAAVPLPLAASGSTAPSVPAAVGPLATFDAAWQAIRETYVDHGRTDQDWQALHEEFRARAAAAPDDASLRPVLRDLLAAIGRSHFELIPGPLHDRVSAAAAGASGSAGDIGLDLAPLDGGGLVVARVHEGGPAHAYGIRPGWVLEAVDGIGVRDLAPAPGEPGAADGSFRLWAAGTALLRGRAGSAVTLSLRDGDERPVSVSVPRREQPGEAVTFGHLPTFFARLEERWLTAAGGRRVAYIHFNIWMTPIAAALDRAIAAARGADGIVIDLRQNPGGILTMLMGVSGHFLADPVSLGTLRTRDAELKLMANPRLVGPDGAPARPYAGKLAILVDASSYSASEIFAGGMQALGRARVFGSRSPGGALPAMLRRLPNGDILEYAIGDFVTPLGERIEGRGVTPDEIVPLTREALLAGTDPPVVAALAWIAREASAAAAAGSGSR